MTSRVIVTPASAYVRHVEMTGGGTNPLGLDLVVELAAALDELADDPDCRSVVLSSRDRHFCAGATAKFDSGGLPWSTSELYAEVPRLFAFPKPVVVALNGAAVGGGAGLAMVGDWRQIATDARIQINFSQLGYTPGFGLTRSLPELVGPHRALELMVTGRPVTAEEAVAMGLCDASSAPEELLNEAVERAEVFATGAPGPVRALKHSHRAALIRDLPAVLHAELARQSEFKQTEDYAEGIRAGKERRPPQFQDR